MTYCVVVVRGVKILKLHDVPSCVELDLKRVVFDVHRCSSLDDVQLYSDQLKTDYKENELCTHGFMLVAESEDELQDKIDEIKFNLESNLKLSIALRCWENDDCDDEDYDEDYDDYDEWD